MPKGARSFPALRAGDLLVAGMRSVRATNAEAVVPIAKVDMAESLRIGEMQGSLTNIVRAKNAGGRVILLRRSRRHRRPGVGPNASEYQSS